MHAMDVDASLLLSARVGKLMLSRNYRTPRHVRYLQRGMFNAVPDGFSSSSSSSCLQNLRSEEHAQVTTGDGSL